MIYSNHLASSCLSGFSKEYEIFRWLGEYFLRKYQKILIVPVVEQIASNLFFFVRKVHPEKYTVQYFLIFFRSFKKRALRPKSERVIFFYKKIIIRDSFL